LDLKSLLSCIAQHKMTPTLSSLIIAGIHLQSKNSTFGKKHTVYIRPYVQVLQKNLSSFKNTSHTYQQANTALHKYIRRRDSSVLNHKGLTLIKTVHNISFRNSMKTHSVSIININWLMFTEVIDVYCKVFEIYKYMQIKQTYTFHL
jgi:hypothetical protein